MRDAARTPRHRRVSCAAGSGQRRTSSMREALYATTSAQHGTDATQDATHDHTTRAANTNGTDNTQQAMQCIRDETNAHLGARCAGGGGVGLIVGLGLPESDVTVESCNSQNWAFGYGGTDCAKSDVPKTHQKNARGDTRATKPPPRARPGRGRASRAGASSESAVGRSLPREEHPVGGGLGGGGRRPPAPSRQLGVPPKGTVAARAHCQ